MIESLHIFVHWSEDSHGMKRVCSWRQRVTEAACSKKRLKETRTGNLKKVYFHCQTHCEFVTWIRDKKKTWWHHQMKTLSVLLALWVGNSPVTKNSPHKGQWRGALMFSLICAWTHASAKHRDTYDLRCYWSHNDITIMIYVVIFYVTKGMIWKNLQKNIYKLLFQSIFEWRYVNTLS